MQNESQFSVGEINAEDVIISSRDIDSNYEPSIEEVKQYGVFLGINPEEDQEFLYIAEKGLKAPIPAPWKACQTKDGQIYYFNFTTGESQWEHPCDEEFRKEFRLAKAGRRGTDQNTLNKDIEQNILDKEVLSHQVNPLEISDLSALLTNPSERANKNPLDDSIISGFNDSQKSKEQVNSDEQASQEGGRKKQGTEKSQDNQSDVSKSGNILDFENTEKKDNNAAKNKELQKIEDEFNVKLRDYERELAKKCEQALVAQKQALEEKLREAANEEEERFEDAQDIQDVQDNFEDELLNQIVSGEIEGEREKLKDQDTLVLNEKWNSMQYNHILALKAERDELNLQIKEAERVKSLLLMGEPAASQDFKTELLAEYKKSLQKVEFDQQEKLENEMKLLKNKLNMAYTERVSKEGYDESSSPEYIALKGEYEEKLEQEKENMYLLVQESKKNMHKEYAHTYTIPEESKVKKNTLYGQIKGVEDERAQFIKLLQGSKETLHSQILRRYELQKLAFENTIGEQPSALKKEVKIIDKDLRVKENIFNSLNKLIEEKKAIEKELLAKESQRYELMMGIKELELALKEGMQQTQQYQAKIESCQSNVTNRNQILQKINEMQTKLDALGKEVKEKEKEKEVRMSYKSVPTKSNDLARQSLEKLLRKVEGIKHAVTEKQKRRSATPGHRPYDHSFERRSYFPEAETEDSSPGFNDRRAAGDILASTGMTFQDREKRWRSSGRRQPETRSSKGSQLHDMSIDFSKELLKKNRSHWYSTFDADEDRTTKNNCSDIWSGLEVEKFKRDLEKEGSFYGKIDQRYKNTENVADKKTSKYLNKEAFYTSVEQYKTRNTEGDEAFTPVYEKSTSGNYSFLDRQRNWMSTQGPVLGLRDENLKKTSTYKNSPSRSPSRYGRKSLQNTSEILSRHEYQRGYAYPIKNNDTLNSRARSIEKKEPTRFLNIKHKIRDERHFHQYDTLIKKYSSGL